MNKLYIIAFLFILIIFLIYKKNQEDFTSDEAVQNISKIYADASGTVTFNNIDVNTINTKNIISNGNIIIDISGNTTITNDLNVLGNINNNNNNIKNNNLTINNKLNVNNIDISGVANFKNSIRLNGTDIRYYLPGITLMSTAGDTDMDITNKDDILNLPVGLWKLGVFDNKTSYVIVNPGFGATLFLNTNFSTDQGYVKVINFGTKPARFKLNRFGASSGAAASLHYGNNTRAGTYTEILSNFLNTDYDSVYIEGPSERVTSNLISSVYVYFANNAKWVSHKK